MKQKIYTGIALLAVVVLISGVSVFAVASPATSSDPLIARSYLNSVFGPAMEAYARTQASAVTNNVNSSINSAVSRIESSFNSNRAGAFVISDLNSGGSVTLNAGAEVMLRSGSADITAGPLINVTTGADQASGGLTPNNMYPLWNVAEQDQHYIEMVINIGPIHLHHLIL